MKRERYIPKDYREIARDDSLGAAAYGGETPNGRHYAIAYSGKRAKPDFHFRFGNADQRQRHIDAWLDGLRARATRKAERQAERKAEGRGLEVGDICRASWGYDQTNINYYEVTALIGSTMVEVREIAQHSVETGFLQGKCAPKKGEYIGKPFRRVAKGGQIKIYDWGCWASKIEPQRVGTVEVYSSSHWTAYA